MFSKCIGYGLTCESVGAKDDWQAAFLFVSEGESVEQVVNAIAIFNYAVWLAQVKHFRDGKSTPPASSAINTIVDIALSFWSRVRSDRWKQAVSRSGQAVSSHDTSTGSSSNRSEAQRARAVEQAAELFRQVPDDAAVAITDGSSIPNPGPCGTGVILFLPENRQELRRLCGEAAADPAGQPTHEPGTRVQHGRTGPLCAYIGLGEGTNNIAELWGPALAIKLLRWHEGNTGKRHRGPLYIFIDSKLTIDICRYRARPKVNTRLGHIVRKLTYDCNETNTIHMHWIAGHADIAVNEMVDALAKRGASLSAAGQGVDAQRASEAGLFLPPGQAPYQYYNLPD